MNKIIKMVVVAAGVGAMLGFAGCGGGSPEGVAKDFVLRLKAADVDGMVACCADKTKAEIGIRMMMAGKDVAEFKKLAADKKFEVGNVKIDGENAKVEWKIDGNDMGEMKLKKTDGAWKIVF